MKKFFIGIIRLYQKTISPDSGLLSFFYQNRICGMFPSCSEYTIEAIDKHGVVRGILLGTKRVILCHPWQKKRIDPVPLREGAPRVE